MQKLEQELVEADEAAKPAAPKAGKAPKAKAKKGVAAKADEPRAAANNPQVSAGDRLGWVWKQQKLARRGLQSWARGG